MNKAPSILLLVLLLVSCSEKHGADKSRYGSEDIDARLEEFESRKRYNSFTPEVLKSIPDGDIEQAIVDYVYDCALGGEGAGNDAAFKKLGPGFRAVYSTIMLEELVELGGFVLYFNDPESRYAEDAAAGFGLMGVSELSGIVRRAMSAARYSGNQVSRDDILSGLDSEFYRASGKAAAMRVMYIRKNPSMFITK